MVIADAACERDRGAATCRGNGGICWRASAVGYERINLRPVLERALADQIDERLAEEENRRLKKMYAEERLKAEIVTEALSKKW